MKSFLLAATMAAIAITAALPVQASFISVDGMYDASFIDSTVEKRRKPRVPGGSGCDSPRDVREHPECRVAK